MTEGKNQLNYFNKILKELDVNYFEQKINTTIFWPAKFLKFDLHLSIFDQLSKFINSTITNTDCKDSEFEHMHKEPFYFALLHLFPLSNVSWIEDRNMEGNNRPNRALF